MATPIYTPVPGVPTEGLPNALFQLLNALRDNTELLTGQRGSQDATAVAKGTITVGPVPVQQMTRITAEGAGFSISGERVVSLDDYEKLRTNVQTLAQDVANLRSVLDSLLTQLKA